MKFKKVLVTTDFSTNSLRALRYLKKDAATTIILFTVVDDWTKSNLYAPQTIHRELYKDAKSKMQERAEADLEKLAKKYFGKRKVVCEAVVSSKEPADEIVKYAAKAKVDAIVMATHGRGKLGSVFLGSNAQKVMHKVRIPLVLIPRSMPV